jgi:16S rRNA (adenine1518-N6/adenine1519-N6)-dimethyltransferase
VNLTSPSQVKAWCIANDFHPNRVLGQNFLIDRNALEAIVDAGFKDVNAKADGLKVLEIGPGLGVMTEEMLSRGAAVTAIEKDPVLADRLKSSLGNPSRLNVIAGDALKVEIDEQFDCMVSNLPYQAGTRILLELTMKRKLPSITVLVQSEVADRLAAQEGSKMRGLAGVWAQLDYDVSKVRKVSASCFWPRPEVSSTVVKLVRHDRNIELSEKERAFFRSLTKKAFEHRRKQLGSVFKDLIQSTARAEELSNKDWIELTKGLVNNEES